MKKFLIACAIVVFASLPCAAADSPWVGTWKLDPAKSTLTGETFTYSKLPNGMTRYSDGSTTDFDFRIDGKEYATASGGTSAWTAAGDKAWDSVARYKGVITSKTHRMLSADGKTYTIQYTSNLPDGTASKGETTYTRVSGNSGLEGTWRSSKVDDSAPDLFIVTMKDDGVLRWETPAYKGSYEGKPDGTDLKMNGPLVPPNSTISFKTDSALSMSYIYKINAKAIYYGTQTLSEDGKSMTDVSWGAGKPGEKTSSYYDKNKPE